MNANELGVVLIKHADWLNDTNTGERADLSGADLSGAILIGADLRSSILGGADLHNADLSGADLSRTDMVEVNLSGANMNGAKLSGSIGIYSFGPIGKQGRIGYAVSFIDGPMFALGCHWGNLADTQKAIIARYGRWSTYEEQIILAGKIVMEEM